MAFDTTVVDDDLTVEPYEEAEEVEATSEEPEQEEVETQEPEQAEADEVEDEAQDEPDSKPKKGAAARIQQLVAEKKAAEAELERLRQEKSEPKQSVSPDGAPQPPAVESFDLDTEEGLDQYFKAQSEYEEKLEDWKFDQKLQQREAAKLQQQREQEITNQFKQRFDANPKFRQDFEQLTTLMQDKPINADPSQLYQGEELMDLLEEVAASPDLYYEIASLPEQAQYAKFGEIQASIKARKSPGNKNIRQSRAPRPPNHTKSNAPIARSDYDKSDDDFLAARGL
ncbi:hypothetical protein [Psychrobacter phenylpyruvicus]|uniref:Scaffolding protein n=1 Tax=Psychrobacter phenylpyruvicus TaxID=29432 RepID=A0A379LIM7_9GAMM|nr:hypothetical protein [Psychrobacter phenylpyruvicus]SUD90403.1 Uncharacterised protein [Psychrobacter phenylpyruvicus]